MSDYKKQQEAFGRLLGIMDDLRSGCPWDMKQTMETLRPLTIEECYELADAILKKDSKEIEEELGDIMLHLVFYAKIADEQGLFDITDVLYGVCEKLIRRHPHIYGDKVVSGEEEVKQNWEKLKLKEGKRSILEGVPTSLPSIIKAYRLQDKTAQVGFEWKQAADVWLKVQEELGELQDAVKSGEKSRIEEEFGDVLFSLINYARFIEVDPDLALDRCNEKFKTRFEYIEANSDKPLSELTLGQMDVLWNEAKKNRLR